MKRLRYIWLLIKDIARVATGKPTATMTTVFELRKERDAYLRIARVGINSLQEIGKKPRGGSVYARQQCDQMAKMIALSMQGSAL